MFPAFWYLMTVVNRRCLKEACQFLNSIYYCLTHFAGHLNIRLDMHSVDYECALCPIQSWINATDELITIEYGHHIIPKATFVFWGVDLTLIGEVEEKLRASPIANQIVEWGEEGGAWLPYRRQLLQHRQKVCVDEPLARKFTVLLMDAHPHNMPRGLQFSQDVR